MQHTTDPNTAFAAERGRQIETALAAPARAEAAAASYNATFDKRVADGTLRPLGGNRFEVNDPGSYDNGEVLVMRRRVVGAQEMRVILPEHNLDTTTGDVALYTREPAWHGLGTVLPAGLTSIDEVLRVAHLDWQVTTVPAQYAWNGEMREHPDRYHTVRVDTGDPLGVVGARYHNEGLIQNRDAFEFLQDLVAIGSTKRPVWDAACGLYGGRKVCVTLRLPNNIVIDQGGVNDEIIPYLVVITSHDGQSPFQVITTPWRPICGNTERFAVRDAYARWSVRHTRSAMFRLNEARTTLGLSVSYFEAFRAEEQALAETDLAIDEFKEVIAELWPANDAPSDRQVENRAKMFGGLFNLYEKNTAQLGNTAYAGERAITEYIDHNRAIRPPRSLRGDLAAARATAALEGVADDLKSHAHRELMLRTRRG